MIGCLKNAQKGMQHRSISLLANFPSNEVTVILNHRHDYFSDHLDPHVSDPSCDELTSTTFVDSNHGHDAVTGKAMTWFCPSLEALILTG